MKKEYAMFAVFKTGGKQYRVRDGDVLRVEKLAAEAGETVQFNDVLMVGGGETRLGTPLVPGAGVQAEILDQIRGEKVVHFVKRRRKHSSKRKKGHRQHLTLLKVTSILPDGAGASGVKAAVGVRGMARESAAAAEDETGKSAAALGGIPKSAGANAPKSMTGGGQKGKSAAAPKPDSDASDDLKRISGIGPKMSDGLKANGVSTFRQIAEWTADDIEDIKTKLSLKSERIQSEGWVEQAKALVAEKE